MAQLNAIFYGYTYMIKTNTFVLLLIFSYFLSSCSTTRTIFVRSDLGSGGSSAPFVLSSQFLNIEGDTTLSTTPTLQEVYISGSQNVINLSLPIDGTIEGTLLILTCRNIRDGNKYFEVNTGNPLVKYNRITGGVTRILIFDKDRTWHFVNFE